MNKKQQFLDLDTSSDNYSNETWATQQILLNMNKTQITHALRSLSQIDKSIYKSWAKELPFNTIHGCLHAASMILKEDENARE